MLVLAGAGNALSQVLLTDSFDGSVIDASKWQALAPLSDSSMSVSDGKAVFFQRGILITQQNLPSSYIVEGRFAFTGGLHDNLHINLRTDGTLTQDWFDFSNNVYVQFSRRSGANGDGTGTYNVALRSYPHGLWANDFTFVNDVYYDFKITDTGNRITVFLNDLQVASLATDWPTGSGSGNKIGLENRGYVPWWPTYDNQVKLDYITISVPEPSSLSLLLAGGAVALARRRKL